MWSAIRRKAFADLRSRWGQQILVFFALFLATAALTIALVVQSSATNPWEENFDKTNGAHVWLVANSMDVDMTPIRELDGVTETTPIIPATSHHPILLDDGTKKEMFIYALDEMPDVAQPLIVKGQWLTENATDEIVLDYGFAQYHHFEVGDTVEILTENGLASFKIIGLSVTSHWVPYNDTTAELIPSIIYVNTATFAEIVPNQDNWMQAFGFRIENPDDSKAYVEQAHVLLHSRLESSLEWQWIKQMSHIQTQMTVLFLSFFSLLGLVTVGFIIANTIGGQIVAQFREIGLLKSIGFTPRQVMLLLVVEQLTIGLIAALAGLGLGLMIAPVFTEPLAEVLYTDAPSVNDPGLMLAIVLGIEIAVLIFTIIPAWQGSRADTVQAINVGYQRNLKGASRPAQLAKKLGFPPVIVFGVKDVFARPLRTTLTVLGLVLSLTVALTAVGADATLKHLSENPMYNQGTPSDLYINRGFVSQETTRAQIEALSELETYYTEVTAYGWAENNLEFPIRLRVLGDDYEAFDFGVDTGRMFSAENEAVAGYGLLTTLDAEIGDEITLLIEGTPLKVKVVGGYAEAFNTSHALLVGLDTYHAQIDPTAEPLDFGLALTDDADRKAIKSDLIAASDQQYDIVVTNQEANYSMVVLRDITTALAMLLLIIAGVNLLITSWLGVRESFRDIAIQKSLGLTPRQIILSVMTNVVVITIIAFLIGIPIGSVIYDSFVSNAGQEIGGGPNFGDMNWLGLFLLLPVFVLIAVLAAITYGWLHRSDRAINPEHGIGYALGIIGALFAFNC